MNCGANMLHANVTSVYPLNSFPSVNGRHLLKLILLRKNTPYVKIKKGYVRYEPKFSQ